MINTLKTKPHLKIRNRHGEKAAACETRLRRLSHSIELRDVTSIYFNKWTSYQSNEKMGGGHWLSNVRAVQLLNAENR